MTKTQIRTAVNELKVMLKKEMYEIMSRKNGPPSMAEAVSWNSRLFVIEKGLEEAFDGKDLDEFIGPDMQQFSSVIARMIYQEEDPQLPMD